MKAYSKILATLCSLLLTFTCSVQDSPKSEPKQAAIACVVTGPAVVPCAVAVTGAQWVVTLVAVGTFTVAAGTTYATLKGYGVSFFAKKTKTWNAICNVEGTAPHCQNKRATGSSTISCTEAKRVATQSAPKGCHARHCQCW